jgi:hypothetical protein
LAAAVKREPDVEVELVDGDRGELTVLLDGRPVAKKRFYLFMPSVQKVLASLRTVTPKNH